MQERHDRSTAMAIPREGLGKQPCRPLPAQTKVSVPTISTTTGAKREPREPTLETRARPSQNLCANENTATGEPRPENHRGTTEGSSGGNYVVTVRAKSKPMCWEEPDREPPVAVAVGGMMSQMGVIERRWHLSDCGICVRMQPKIAACS
jgi:hypothetical protein